MTAAKDGHKRSRGAPELARARQLAARVLVDLRLTRDAVRAAGLPYSDLSKVLRAEREMSDLLARIEGRAGEEELITA